MHATNDTETRTVSHTNPQTFDGPHELVGFLTGTAKDDTVDIIRLNGQTTTDRLTLEVEIEADRLPAALTVSRADLDGDTVEIDPAAIFTITLGNGTETRPNAPKYIDPAWVTEVTVDRRVTVPARFSRVGETADIDKTHGWPGVAGYTHRADTWCPLCADAHEDIDTSGESDAAILADSEADAPGPCCANCGATLDVRTVGGEN